MEPVTNKVQMYRLLIGGAFGNTITQFTSLEAWRASGEDKRFPSWGVRSLAHSGYCRLNCPTEEVEATCNSHGFCDGFNISIMISCLGQVTWLGEVWDNGGSLECDGIEYPERIHDFRELMKHPQHWLMTDARMLLRRHLNPSSLADLYAVFDLWPGHVVELSALETTYGTVPGRNAIIWEVRGTY